MYNSNLEIEILDYLTQYRDARAIHTDELVERFYPTPHGTVYDTLDHMVSDRLIAWNQRTDLLTLRTKRATQEQIETVDRWVEETGFRTFEEIREKCREVAQGNWAVARQIERSQGVR